MPIQLNYTDSNTSLNVPAMYLFAFNAIFDNIALTVTWSMGGYISAAAKTAGHLPLITRYLTATFAQLGISAPTTLTQTAASFYIFALANDPFYAGGTIVA